MATSVDDCRIIEPFMPSLLHIASVKVALLLSNDFGYKTLKKVYSEIQDKNSTVPNEENQGFYDRAKKNFLFVPSHLRKGVWKAISGLQTSITWWQTKHFDIEVSKCSIYWRSDGTIDTIKTAQHLVLNETIDVTDRFEVACMYCLEKSIQSLWLEMEASGEAHNFKICNSLARFWIKRMREGSEVPWAQAVLKYMDCLEPWDVQVPIFSSFFHLLQPSDRQKCLQFLGKTNIDDLRLCVYGMNKEEEKEIVATNAYEILIIYLQWPLQDFFLQMAEKLLEYLSDELFIATLLRIINLFANFLVRGADFDPFELWVGFWNRSPARLKEIAIRHVYVRNSVYLCANEIKRRRKPKK